MKELAVFEALNIFFFLEQYPVPPQFSLMMSICHTGTYIFSMNLGNGQGGGGGSDVNKWPWGRATKYLLTNWWTSTRWSISDTAALGCVWTAMRVNSATLGTTQSERKRAMKGSRIKSSRTSSYTRLSCKTSQIQFFCNSGADPDPHESRTFSWIRN